MSVCLVYFRSHHLFSEEDSSILGIYTDRKQAIFAGRECSKHGDDDYSVMEFELNTIDCGHCVWFRDCDNDKKKWARKSILSYWSDFPEYLQLEKK